MSIDWEKIATGIMGSLVLTGPIWGPVGAVVQAAYFVAMTVLDLLPDAVDLNLTVPDGFIYGYSIFNTFLPLTEALAVVGVFTGLIVAGIVFRVAVTVYHLIPKPLMGT